MVQSRIVCWTEYTDPLPFPSLAEFQNLEALATICSHPDLFKVSTPINIDCFQSLLANHPNQPFVCLVCQGLHEGFWPFAFRNGLLFGTTLSALPKLSLRQISFRNRFKRRSKRKGTHHCLGQICCLVCTVCQFMLFQN